MGRACLTYWRGRRMLGIALLTATSAASAASLPASGSAVRVPRVATDVVSAYARLHAEGLRVSIPRALTFSAASPPVVIRSTPAPGTRLAPGSVVTLHLSRAARVSPPAKRRHGVAVPSFIGRPVAAAYAWARRRRLAFTAHLTALHAGAARGLLANFLIVAQRPGDGRRSRSLTAWGRQPSPPSLATPPAPTGVTTGPAAPPPAPAQAPPSPPPPTTTYYQNPVFSTSAFPDPFVLDNGGAHSDYWAFATGDLFPVLHSADLVHWTAEPRAMTARPSWVVQSGDWHPWAPSVVQTGQSCPGSSSSGCYVMYYVGRSSATGNPNCIGVATSPDPGGLYVDLGPLEQIGAGTAGLPIGCGDAAGLGNIDPSPFVDPASGSAYLYLSTNRACNGGTCARHPTLSVIPLAADLVEASGARIPLFSGDAGTWEDAGGGAGPTVEGPSVELHDGTYYLLYSGGSYTGAYGMGYATSGSPTGPFTKSASNPILASTASAFSVGGGDRLITGPHGGLWLVYAARLGSVSAPRTLWIDPFGWAPGGDPGAPDVPIVSGPTTTPQTAQP